VTSPDHNKALKPDWLIFLDGTAFLIGCTPLADKVHKVLTAILVAHQPSRTYDQQLNSRTVRSMPCS
jgi:hypothetical protein